MGLAQSIARQGMAVVDLETRTAAASLGQGLTALGWAEMVSWAVGSVVRQAQGTLVRTSKAC